MDEIYHREMMAVITNPLHKGILVGRQQVFSTSLGLLQCYERKSLVEYILCPSEIISSCLCFYSNN